MSNVYRLPFEDFYEADEEDIKTARNAKVGVFMESVNDFCEANGVDTNSNEYLHQAAVIMAQLQIILMGVK